MNYIRHLNAFFQFVRNDERLTCSHVSLYLALFQYWNFNRFQNPFPVYRINLMQLSKIGSKNTYHKCIKHLHNSGYIIYHPPSTKFQVVQISMKRLDIKEEYLPNYKQLDLFSINNDTDSVPDLTDTSTENDTDAVSKMGHSINSKLLKNESKQPAHKFFQKNVVDPDPFGKELSKKVNNLAGVPNPVHQPSTIAEVEKFFSQHNYPLEEARKFYNHYKAIGWKIKGITPIEDWQAAGNKWMLNAGKYLENKQHSVEESKIDVNQLFEMYKAGKKIFHLITEDHFIELTLQLTPEIMELARQERINQLTGSNQGSILRLLQAYEENEEMNPLLMEDRNQLLSLAQRVAVICHLNTENCI